MSPVPRGNAAGAAWVLASAVTFSLSMTLIKFLGHDFPATVQTFVRQSVALVVLLPWILRAPRRVFTTSRPWFMLSRSAATSLSLILSYTSYHYLGLAQANSLSFTRTLFMVPLAILLLKERVPWTRVAATLFGFCGVLIILQPWSADGLIGWPALYGLLAALLVSWSVIGVKAMSRDHGQVTLLAWSALLGVLFTLPPALLDWRMPDTRQMALLTLMGVLSTATQAFYIRGMAIGDATRLGPLDYSRIVFTTIFGYVFFSEVPGLATLAGSAVIIVAAIVITFQGRSADASTA